MHIAFVATPDLSYLSGSSLSLRYTVEALGDLGVECTVLCQHAPPASMHPLVEYVELPLPLDYQVITDSRPTNADLFACTRILAEALLDLESVTAVHAIYGTFTGLAAGLAAALLDRPLLVSTFGRDVEVGATQDNRYRKMMLMAYSQAHTVFAADDEIAASIMKSYAGPQTKTLVLQPAVNFALARQYTRQRPLRGRARVLAVQSSFNERKGLPVLLDALALVAAEVPDASLTVVGHDDTPGSRIQRRLMDQADRRGIKDRLTFTGHLSHEETLLAMRDHDLLVDPRTLDSFSSCVYEAMTIGLPVVASDVGCNQAALGDTAAGILVPAADAGALADAICAVLRDTSVAKRLAANGHTASRRFEHRLGVPAVAEEMMHAYAGVRHGE
jgi:glycosyltransferase involved in cell wall biosynthesis